MVFEAFSKTMGRGGKPKTLHLWGYDFLNVRNIIFAYATQL